MADAPTPKDEGFWPGLLTPKRWSEFLLNIIKLERTVTRLKHDQERMEAEIAELKRENVKQSAQIDLLADFVRSTLKT